MSNVRKYLPIVLTIYIAFVFIQSLFFKFTGSPETDYIFGTLNTWAASLGFDGLFAKDGIFSQYVIGTAELIASTLLLLGLAPKWRILQIVGAAMAIGVISGAIFFHLFTPLGVSVPTLENGEFHPDGGLLFGMACGVWISAATLLFLNKGMILGLLNSSAAHPARG
ncbi:MAG: hypothetical protein E6R12_13580 [Sphingomonadales bacterium]|nr:MAG: hypothetical protein E6R12_13580 [Sphingomonadales bacterium]